MNVAELLNHRGVDEQTLQQVPGSYFPFKIFMPWGYLDRE